MTDLPAKTQHIDEQLLRAIGVLGLAANIVNTTVGASIFKLPADMSQQLGAAAPLAFVVCALAMGLFVTSFALAGSRVSLTGGLYAYAELAFGRYVGFITGVFFYTTAVLSVAAVVNFFAGTVFALLPGLAGPVGRFFILLLVYGTLAFINVRGVREGTSAVGVVTVAKLLPLLVLVGAGIFFVKWSNLAWPGWPAPGVLGHSVLLLLFAFFGIEVALIPSGEVKNPARTVPRAIYLALALTTVLYLLIQLVAQGTLGAKLAQQSNAPLAAAAAVFLGHAGQLLLLGGATISAFGFIASDMLSSPRILFALGRDGILPRALTHVHPRFRTPDVAIVLYAVLAFIFSLISTFEALAVMANVAALLLYLVCCAAAFVLIQRDVRTEEPPFNFPGARLVPVISIVLILWILAQATQREFKIAGMVFLVGTVLYALRVALGRVGQPSG